MSDDINYMSDSVLITIVGITLLAGALAIVAHRLMYKKSVIFRIAAVMTAPLIITAIVGLVVGARGIGHVVWAVPLALVSITAALEVFARMLQNPFREMQKVVDALSTGDVNIEIDEKYLKGDHETARILRQIAKLAEALKNIEIFADRIGKSELNVEYNLLGENDSLGKAMLDMRANLQKAEKEKEERHKEDERRNWVTQGIAKFADLLRSNNDNIEELSYSIISNLVKYVNANQAGIFIHNDDIEEKNVLELKACYAYERRKYLHKTIIHGEGLIGTCFLERDTIYISDVPQTYASITSGLGKEAPDALLLVPLKINEQIYGVMEIASFKKFEPFEIEFVEKVAESIASTISAVKVNMRTNKLLEQSKIQSEELVNQEEELRQSMEEMQATQEEMSIKMEESQRSHQEALDVMSEMEKMQETLVEEKLEVDSLMKAVDNLFIRITYSTDMTLLDLNNAALEFFGLARERLVGSKLTSKMKATDIPAFEQKWATMLAGDSFSDEGVRKSRDGEKRVWYMYTPIKDFAGNVSKVLMMGKVIV